jgi:protein-S-isoprenylcysteine O-methyltransferase Ste14
MPETVTLVRRLARLRVPLGFASAIFVLWMAEPTRMSLVWGAAVAAAGEALRVWAAGHINKSQEVTMSGPYRFVAHPLYAGSAIMGAGLSLASNRLSVAVVVVAYLGVTLTAAIRSEEAFLRGAFGDEYDRYRAGTRRVSGTPFSLSRAMANHEPRAIAGLAAAILLLFLKATYNGAF